jgi:hypothetical protein
MTHELEMTSSFHLSTSLLLMLLYLWLRVKRFVVWMMKLRTRNFKK